jgi:Glycosyl transferase family 2
MTIVISVGNGTDDPAVLLDSVADAVPRSESVELVVVLAATSDTEFGAPAARRAFPFELRVERTPKASAGAMRNAGVAAARGEVIWLVDGRALVTGTAFARHRAHDRLEAEVLVGPCAVPSGDPEATDTSWWYHHHDRRLGELGEITDPRDCSFANASAPAGLLRSARFDEGYRTARMTDVDYGVRLLDAGVGIAFDRDAGLPLSRSDDGHWRSSAAAGADRVRFTRSLPDRAATVFRAAPGRLERNLRRWAPSAAGRRLAPATEASARTIAELARRGPGRRWQGTADYVAGTLSLYSGVAIEVATSDPTGAVANALHASLDTSRPPRSRTARWWQEQVADRVRMALLPLRVHHVHGTDPIDRAADDLLAVTTVRNGAFYIHSFLEHHRRLGVSHFLVLDNGSTDGTVGVLCEQPDVTMFRTSVPYRTHENLMKRYMVRRHSQGKWNLFVDIDELFDYPASDRIGLRDLLGYLTQHHYTAVVAQMLDLFPEEPLADSAAEVADLLGAFPYFDLSGISKRQYEYDDDPASRLSSHHGGIRRTVFGTDNGLTKAALTHIDDEIETFVGWHHARRAKFADISCVLLHFPFTRAFYEKAEEAARTHRYGLGASHEYRAYWAVLQDDPKLSLHRPTAQRFRDVDQLVELGFITESEQYRRWVADHARNPR